MIRYREPWIQVSEPLGNIAIRSDIDYSLLATVHGGEQDIANLIVIAPQLRALLAEFIDQWNGAGVFLTTVHPQIKAAQEILALLEPPGVPT